MSLVNRFLAQNLFRLLLVCHPYSFLVIIWMEYLFRSLHFHPICVLRSKVSFRQHIVESCFFNPLCQSTSFLLKSSTDLHLKKLLIGKGLLWPDILFFSCKSYGFLSSFPSLLPSFVFSGFFSVAGVYSAATFFVVTMGIT